MCFQWRKGGVTNRERDGGVFWKIGIEQRDICWEEGQMNGNLINPGKRENKGD